MDARAPGPILQELAVLLEVHGEPARAAQFRDAVHAPSADADVAAVLAEVAAEGGATLLDQLRESTPEGVFEMLRVPGLGPARVRRLWHELPVESLQELEDAARDGRLAALPRFGARLAEQVLRGISALRDAGAPVLLPHALAEARRLLPAIAAMPGVERVELAGAARRRLEVVRELPFVAACAEHPVAVAARVAALPEVREVVGGVGRSTSLVLRDGLRVELHCVTPPEFALALWRATGGDAHVAAVTAAAAARGVRFEAHGVRDAGGAVVPVTDEATLYRLAGWPVVPPEGRDAAGAPPAHPLVTLDDLAGVLHCHSQYSDGGATIAELAAAARARGWRYLGISDHSQSAFYAGGLDRDTLLRQHDEIDALNAATPGFRVLKGVEADILPCGRVDYPVDVLDRFDYVIASVHSRFGMDGARMTERICKALDDPHVTILGHPTGRLLLTREPYAVDLDAVFAKAAEVGVAMELNADPHRLDLDWRHLPRAAAAGALIAIGPDAHAVAGLENAELGVWMARKGGLGAAHVLNTRDADAVVAFAQRRRPAGAPA
jgi:DNA polymerase (family 10)